MNKLEQWIMKFFHARHGQPIHLKTAIEEARKDPVYLDLVKARRAAMLAEGERQVWLKLLNSPIQREGGAQ